MRRRRGIYFSAQPASADCFRAPVLSTIWRGITPACANAIGREAIDRVGLFDPRYFLYYEEVDHCRAVRQAGWSVIYCPYSHVVHLGGESAETEGPVTSSGRQISALQIESELLYFRKHDGVPGVFAAVSLAILGDVINALKGLVKLMDTARAVAASRHAWTMLTLVFKTGLASRPTR
jgi:N-acetylglucosaminyl-diphospho-decaprenol L-rhamnosyltransferase